MESCRMGRIDKKMEKIVAITIRIFIGILFLWAIAWVPAILHGITSLKVLLLILFPHISFGCYYMYLLKKINKELEKIQMNKKTM